MLLGGHPLHSGPEAAAGDNGAVVHPCGGLRDDDGCEPAAVRLNGSPEACATGAEDEDVRVYGANHGLS